MKKLLLSCFIAIGIGTNAQNVVFQDSFEDYTDFSITNVGSWTLLDVDQSATYGFNGVTFANSGVKKSYQVFNATTTTPALTPTSTSNWTARTGNKSMVVFAATTPSNNDWLISPKIQLSSDGGTLSFWAKSCDGTYGAEKFRVYVSTTGTAVANFTAINAVQTTPADVTWHEYTYNLSAYAGQQVYIGIQCTSNDQFGFAVDDFTVTSTVAPTAVPNCIAANSPANGATAVNVGAYVSWTASPYATSYDLYLDTNVNPTTLIGNFTGTGYASPTTWAANTTYYWKVVPKNTLGSATGCSTNSFSTSTPNPPGCVGGLSPANGATGVAYGTTPLAWTAPTTGGTPTGYQVYFGTNASSLPLLTTTAATATGINITGTAANTTYYWQIVAINADGSATGCPVYSLTTMNNPFLPYCSGNLTFSSGIEPITSVKLNDLTNTSSAATTGATAHENFISKVATVEQGKTYPITFEGYTGAAGNTFTTRFIVFIDWNQDGDFLDSGETYFGTTGTAVALTGSTGVDGKTATGNIVVPAGATLGNTRMRIKKNYGTSSFYLSPCYSSGTTATATTGTAGYGQAEDYTINVVSPTMAVSDVNKGLINVYPNPFVDVVKISDIKDVKSISVNDISGRQIKTLAPATELNLSQLKEGLYIINLNMHDGSVKSFKTIKK